MKMIKSRILTSHTYNEYIADEIAMDIQNIYYHEFLKLRKEFLALKEKEQKKSSLGMSKGYTQTTNNTLISI